MKCALLLLLATMSALAQAQPIYRCDDGHGPVVFQKRFCAGSPVEGGIERVQPHKPVTPAPSTQRASFVAPAAGQDSSRNQEPRRHRPLRTGAALPAQALPPRRLANPLPDRKAAEYAENRSRCENAMRIAALCGKHAGLFFCDEKGFRPIVVREESALRRPAADRNSAFNMEQCAVRAAKSGP